MIYYVHDDAAPISLLTLYRRHRIFLRPPAAGAFDDRAALRRASNVVDELLSLRKGRKENPMLVEQNAFKLVISRIKQHIRQARQGARG